MLNLQAGDLKLIVPASWSEVSLSQFFSYVEATTDTDVLAALSGVSLTELRPGSVANLSKIMTLLTWRTDIPSFDQLPVPLRLELNNRTIKPKKLSKSATIGQMWDVEREINAMKGGGQPVNYITLARKVLSIYLYPAVSGMPYTTSADAESIIGLIDALPVTQALPLAHFVFDCFTNPVPAGTIQVTHIPEKKDSWLTKAKYFFWTIRHERKLVKIA